MANTPSFNWETPDDTDLVKDGAAAMRTLGNAIDSSMADLKGGTSGQVLSKNSNTDMDFIWVAQDDSNAIQNTLVDAKGDLVAASAADTPARLAVGTNGQILTADSSEVTGLKWTTPAVGSLTLLSTTSMSGSSTTVSGISGSYKNLLVIIKGAYASSSGGTAKLRLNSDGSGHSHGRAGVGGSTFNGGSGNDTSSITFADEVTNSSTFTNTLNAAINIYRYTETGGIVGNISAVTYQTSSSRQGGWNTSFSYNNGSAISAITILSDFSWSGGTIYIYGVN